MSRTELRIRSFQPDDAAGVSRLFSEVYGERYVYPEVYLPSIVGRRNADGAWHSAVAMLGDTVVGHAALLLPPAPAQVAEIAMVAVSAGVTGRSIGLRLCRHLCQWAGQGGWHMLLAMLVCSHRQSQRMAAPLDFATTGLLLDYLPSSFADAQRESYVLSCLPLRPRPLPDIAWPEDCGDWLPAMQAHFGVAAEVRSTLPPQRIEITSDGILQSVTVHHCDAEAIAEVCQLAPARARLVRLRIDAELTPAVQQLRRTGLRPTGLMPARDGGWYWLMQNGLRAAKVELHCALARSLLAGAA